MMAGFVALAILLGCGSATLGDRAQASGDDRAVTAGVAVTDPAVVRARDTTVRVGGGPVIDAGGVDMSSTGATTTTRTENTSAGAGSVAGGGIVGGAGGYTTVTNDSALLIATLQSNERAMQIMANTHADTTNRIHQALYLIAGVMGVVGVMALGMWLISQRLEMRRHEQLLGQFDQIRNVACRAACGHTGGGQ